MREDIKTGKVSIKFFLKSYKSLFEKLVYFDETNLLIK